MIYGYAHVSTDAPIIVNPRTGARGRILDELRQRSPCTGAMQKHAERKRRRGYRLKCVSRSTISRLVGRVGVIQEFLGFYSELC